ncbi:transketolase [Paenibacillus hamazuiensis]|uniref:transketolase n=1 Tax=Paenibacillus hamazuiensis TaxID=2936508 RepID=UPI00200F3A64|nr:transketolase [Paenibacillus hamazuiensis]
MEMTQEQLKTLKALAASTRKLIVETVHYANAGHMGGPMSVTDLLVALYFEVMNIRPDQPDWEERDRFVLSKGHSAIALYTVMALRGYLPVEELKTFDKIDSRLQAHPDMGALPGLDMSTGSLGQGISAAVGMALGAKLTGKSFTTFCVLGDGEAQEGQVWEAADVAVRYALDNLVVFLDYNKLQQYGWEAPNQSREVPIQSPETKWSAFGWNVVTIDGHRFEEIVEACDRAKSHKGRPTIIIANTVKGKGVSFMENAYLWHSKVPTRQELEQAITEITAGGDR